MTTSRKTKDDLERHEYRRKKKEIKQQLDDEDFADELRRAGLRDDDEEQGIAPHSE